MVNKGVLVPETEPTEWLNAMTPQKKPHSDEVRICVDLRPLNKFVKRPHHPVRTPKDVVATIPPASRFFSTFDAKHGYFQVALDEPSQRLTTFCTPWGRYRHLRATMGLTSAGDEFNRRMDAALADIPNLEKIVDDILLHDSDLETHLSKIRLVLERCRTAGITLNPKKANLAKSSVRFAGYIISKDGIKADPEKLKGIREFPKPKNITDLRSFLGLAEQLAGFTPSVAGAMQPLRPLLRTTSPFHWDAVHDRAFEATKAALISPPVLANFDPDRPTCLQTDASRTKVWDTRSSRKTGTVIGG